MKLYKLKDVCPNWWNKLKDMPNMAWFGCTSCNQFFHLDNVTMRIDNTIEYINEEETKAISPDGVNAYWLSCPYCGTIHKKGFRQVAGVTYEEKKLGWVM